MKLAQIMLASKLVLSINPSAIDNSSKNLQPSFKDNKVFDGLGSVRIADKVDSLFL